ncbi:MAG TPA: YdcH family protein [Polyangiaceae bacterium]
MDDVVMERIRELELKHRDLDTAVMRLGRRAYLTPGEQREFAELKKRKLITKDQLMTLRRV